MRARFVPTVVWALVLPVALIRADHYVAQGGQTPQSPYTNWAGAASNIQAAINAASAGATVHVAAGVYTAPDIATNYWGTNVVFINRPLTLRGAGGNPAETIIDGGGSNRGVAVVYGGEGAVVIEGVAVTNGRAAGDGHGRGGGILLYATAGAWTGIVRNCIISGNRTEADSQNYSGGAGAYCVMGTAGAVGLFTNCQVRGNLGDVAASFGGGVYLRNGGMLVDCVIEHNTGYRGGGIYIGNANSMMDRCVVRHNTAAGIGGGIANYVRAVNCLFHDNISDSGGGGAHSSYDGFLRNCTIVGNTAAVNGGGIFLGGASPFAVENCIVYGNAGAVGYTNYLVAAPAVQIFSNNCSAPLGTLNTYGAGNMDAPPLLAPDFQLTSASPCLDTGANQPWMTQSVDLAGRRRLDMYRRQVDMGCFEYLRRGTVYLLR